MGSGRRFRTLLGASVVSGIGDGLVLVAMPLLAASLTRDPRLVAGVVVAQRLPWLLLSLHGGALVDRLPLRRLLPAFEGARAVALLGLSAAIVLDTASLPLLYAVAFVIGTGDTLVASGLHAAIPQMVPPADLQKANGRIHTTQVIGGEFAGPAIGGVLFGVAVAIPFVANGTTFLVSALLLALVLPDRAVQEGPRPPSGITAEVREGLAWFVRHDVLRLLAVLIGAFAFFQAGVLALLVLLATDQLGLAEGAFGLFLAMGAVGNIGGAFLAERLPGHRVSAIVLVAGAVTAVAYVVMGATTSAVVAATAFLVEGVAIAAANVVTVSLRQQLIPLHMLGRVGAAFRLCIFGTMPLGALLAGLLADRVGVGTAIVVCGVAQLAVLATVTPASRRLLSADRIAVHPPT